MNRRTYQIIAIVGLIPAGLFTWEFGGHAARWLGNVGPTSLANLLGLLGYLLTLLVAVVGWAVVLLPLRARAGFRSISDDVAQVRQQGLAASVRAEHEKLEAAKSSGDPEQLARYHGRMAAVGVLLCPAVQFARWRRRSPMTPPE